MAIEKISVSVDEDLVQEVRRRAGERGVSAFVTRAIRHELEHSRLAEFLAELESEIGPPDEALVAEASAALQRVDAVPARRSPKKAAPAHTFRKTAGRRRPDR